MGPADHCVRCVGDLGATLQPLEENQVLSRAQLRGKATDGARQVQPNQRRGKTEAAPHASVRRGSPRRHVRERGGALRPRFCNYFEATQHGVDVPVTADGSSQPLQPLRLDAHRPVDERGPLAACGTQRLIASAARIGAWRRKQAHTAIPRGRLRDDGCRAIGEPVSTTSTSAGGSDCASRSSSSAPMLSASLRTGMMTLISIIPDWSVTPEAAGHH